MCAGSQGEIRDAPVEVYMGYYGGMIRVGDARYSVDSAGGRENGNTSEDEMVALLSGYEPGELARLFVGLVRDSDE